MDCARTDQRISEVVKREESRLRNFIRRRVPDPRDAEDILQEVFYELVEANSMLMLIEHVTAWLYRERSMTLDSSRFEKFRLCYDGRYSPNHNEWRSISDAIGLPGRFLPSS